MSAARTALMPAKVQPMMRQPPATRPMKLPTPVGRSKPSSAAAFTGHAARAKSG